MRSIPRLGFFLILTLPLHATGQEYEPEPGPPPTSASQGNPPDPLKAYVQLNERGKQVSAEIKGLEAKAYVSDPDSPAKRAAVVQIGCGAMTIAGTGLSPITGTAVGIVCDGVKQLVTEEQMSQGEKAGKAGELGFDGAAEGSYIAEAASKDGASKQAYGAGGKLLNAAGNFVAAATKASQGKYGEAGLEAAEGGAKVTSALTTGATKEAAEVGEKRIGIVKGSVEIMEGVEALVKPDIDAIDAEATRQTELASKQRQLDSIERQKQKAIDDVAALPDDSLAVEVTPADLAKPAMSVQVDSSDLPAGMPNDPGSSPGRSDPNMPPHSGGSGVNTPPVDWGAISQEADDQANKEAAAAEPSAFPAVRPAAAKEPAGSTKCNEAELQRLQGMAKAVVAGVADASARQRLERSLQVCGLDRPGPLCAASPSASCWNSLRDALSYIGNSVETSAMAPEYKAQIRQLMSQLMAVIPGGI